MYLPYLPLSYPSTLGDLDSGKDPKLWAGSGRARACLEAHQAKAELLSVVQSRDSQWVAEFPGNSAVLI